jgi:glycerol kinase
LADRYDKRLQEVFSMSQYVLAIDQGTTGTTVVVLDRDLKVRARVNQEFPQIYPKPGWAEHDPEQIWRSVEKATRRALADSDISGGDIKAIGITNQRETTMIWERETSHPVHNAIVWLCRRTADMCERLKKAGHEDLFRRKTGLLLDPYFSGTKIRWLLENVGSVRERAEGGELAFGTVDSFLVWRLTGGKVHVTDATNASRTLLCNLETLEWDDELLDVLDVPRELLPEIKPSSHVYGETTGLDFLPDGIPVAGIAGDQQAALFGQACFDRGQAKCTYGTGAFLVLNVGHRPIISQQGLLGTVAWQLEGEVSYALEGSIFIAGAAVQWLRDGLGLIETAPEIEALASQVEDSGGVIFVPALSGLGAPHWRPEARGLIKGLTRGTNKAHLARATLEGIALSVHEVLEVMQQESGESLGDLRVDGGAAANDLLMQLQADLLGSPISRPEMLETTALGSALLAGLATSVWKDTKEISERWKEEKRFEPSADRARVRALLERWKEAVEQT